MSAFSIAKEVLMKPFMKKGHEFNSLFNFGRRKKTEFLEDTTLVESHEEVNLLKLWINLPNV